MNYREVYSKVVALCINVFATHSVSQHKAEEKIKFYLSAPGFDEVPSDLKDKVFSDVLAHLLDIKLIDDARYVENYIASNTRSFSPDGSRLVINKLLSKGIQREVLENYDRMIKEMDLENAKKLLTKKFGESDLTIVREKKLKYLYQRGYILADMTYGFADD